MRIKEKFIRIGFSLGIVALSAGALFSIAPAAFAATATTTSTGAYQVMIMTHLCNSSIKNAADFNAMENGKPPITVLADDVLACPTTGLTTSAPVAGTIAAPRSTYDFTVTSDAQTQTLSSSGTFMPTKVCESDVGLDLNGDGQMSTSTCLDISHYQIPVMTSSASSTLLKVMETQAPAGYHFGILRFTPVALDGNNDSEALTYLNPQTGEIDLNMVPDKDGMIMLHVYQFQNATTTGTGSGGTGTTTQMMNNTGMLDQNTQTVRAGTSVDFSGRNFGHEETVMVMLQNGSVVGTAHSDGGGNFSTGSLTVPSMPGTYTYLLVGQDSGISASATVTVTP